MKNRITLPIVSAVMVALMILVLFLTVTGKLPGAGGGEEQEVPPVKEKTYPLAELQEDFNRVRSVVERKHPMFFANEEEVEAIFDRQFALLEGGMGELDFYRILSPAMAALNCGHSNVLLSRAYEQHVRSEVSLLPLKVAVLQDRLYVTFGYHTSWEAGTLYALDDSKGLEVCFERDLAEAIAAESGFTVAFRKIEAAYDNPFTPLVTALNSGQIDVGFGLLYVRTDPETQVDFTSVYLPADQSPYTEPIAYAVQQGDATLKANLDSAISALISNGTLDALRLEYGVSSN